MSEQQPKALIRLRWWFWLVLFVPTMVMLIGTALVPRLHPRGGLSGLVFINFCLGPGVNLACSLQAARMVVCQRDPRGGSSPWMFLWAPLFFFLNMAIVFGGCALVNNLAR